MKKLLKLVFVVLGFFALALGTIGIVLPLLPTTPLYLLAAFCFAKGSVRFHTWFTNTQLYKKYLDNFVRTRSMTRKAKLSICIPVSLMLILVFVLAPVWYIKLLIAGVLLFKWWYFICRIKTSPTPASTAKTETTTLKGKTAERKNV